MLPYTGLQRPGLHQPTHNTHATHCGVATPGSRAGSTQRCSPQYHPLHRTLLPPAQAVKLADLDNPDDLATGPKVKPERLAARNVSSRDLLYECNTWRDVASLVAESQDKLSHDKGYGVRVLNRLADIVNGNVVDLSKDSLISVDGISASEKMGSAARAGSRSGSIRASGAKPLREPERKQAMRVFDTVLLMTASNMDSMRSSDVYNLLMLLTRINHVHKGVLKAIMVYMKTFPKRFKVAELFGALSAYSSLGLSLNPQALVPILGQATRGLKYATHEDLANALVSLHKMPRNTVDQGIVTAVVKSCQRALLDLQPEAVAHLVMFMAQQSHNPHPRFMGQLRGLLAERLPNLRDPHSAVVLVQGLTRLGQQIHGQGGVLEQVQAWLVRGTPKSKPIAHLNVYDLSDLGTALAEASDAAILEQQELGQSTMHVSIASPAFTKAYVACAKKSMEEMNEVSSIGVLLGLGTVAQPGKVASGLAPPLGMTQELLTLIEDYIVERQLGVTRLRQLATAIGRLIPEAANAPPYTGTGQGESSDDEGLINPIFIAKFRLAIVRGLLSSSSAAELTECVDAATLVNLMAPPPKKLPECPQGQALLKAAAELSQTCATAMQPTPQKKLRKGTKAAQQQEEEVKAIEGAKARAAAASKACSQAAEGAAVESSAGFAEAAALRARDIADGRIGSVLPSGEGSPPTVDELEALRVALGLLQGVNVNALLLPEPLPDPEQWDVQEPDTRWHGMMQSQGTAGSGAGGYGPSMQGPRTLDYLDEDFGGAGDAVPDPFEDPASSGFVGSTRSSSRRGSSRAAGGGAYAAPSQSLGDEDVFAGNQGGYFDGEDEDAQYFEDFGDDMLMSVSSGEWGEGPPEAAAGRGSSQGGSSSRGAGSSNPRGRGNWSGEAAVTRGNDDDMDFLDMRT